MVCLRLMDSKCSSLNGNGVHCFLDGAAEDSTSSIAMHVVAEDDALSAVGHHCLDCRTKQALQQAVRMQQLAEKHLKSELTFPYSKL